MPCMLLTKDQTASLQPLDIKCPSMPSLPIIFQAVTSYGQSVRLPCRWWAISRWTALSIRCRVDFSNLDTYYAVGEQGREVRCT